LTSTAFEHLAAETPGCGQLVQGRHARKQGLNGRGSNSRLGDRKLNAVTITQSRLMHANSTADRERQFDVSVDRSDFTSVHTIPTDPLRTPSPTACLCFFGGGGGAPISPRQCGWNRHSYVVVVAAIHNCWRVLSRWADVGKMSTKTQDVLGVFSDSRSGNRGYFLLQNIMPDPRLFLV